MSCGLKDGKPLIHTPIKAIRAKCLNCGNHSAREVELCPVKDCALYPYRFGKHPTIKKRILTDDQKAKLTKRLSEARGKK